MIIGEAVFTKDIQVEDDLMPLIESLTGRQGQDALEYFVIGCLENFLDAQLVLNAMYIAKKTQQGY